MDAQRVHECHDHRVVQVGKLIPENAEVAEGLVVDEAHVSLQFEKQILCVSNAFFSTLAMTLDGL